MHERSYFDDNDATESTLWVLEGLPEANARLLERWLDDIAALDIGDWIRIGRMLETRRSDTACREASRAIVDAIAADRGLQLSTWFIRDLVTTSCHTASEYTRTASPSRGRHLDQAQRAAEGAALAIALGGIVPSRDYRTLCDPFRHVCALCIP